MQLLSTFQALYGGSCDPIAVYLTWQRSPDTTMTIRWITPLDHPDDTIEFRAEDETLWQTGKGVHFPMPADSPFFIHTVELTNLHPETNYFFRLNPEGIAYKFQTMPSVLDHPISFVAGGDIYHDDIDVMRETHQQAAKTSPLFAIIGGDIAYAVTKKIDFLPRWTEKWVDLLIGQKYDRWLTWLIVWQEDMVTPDGRLVPILPVLGNHDVSGRFDQTPKEAPFFYSLFAMPGSQGYNVLDFGNYMSILLMDSSHTHPIGGAQTQWLEKTLEKRGDVSHLFAVYHVPAFPSVRKIDNEYCSQVRNHWTPLFEKYRLTAAFENHDHAYKRTYPIKNGRIDQSGVVYIGDGAWGVAHPRKPRRVAQKWYLAYTASERHFINVTLKNGRRHIAAIGPEGRIIDQIEW